jgi:hypothetical protein
MAISAGVTAGAAFAGAAAAVVAGRAFEDAIGAGADAAEPPPELHAAIAAAATMNRVGRTTRL